MTNEELLAIQKIVQDDGRKNRTEIMTYIESHVEKQIKLLNEGPQLILEKMAEKERIENLEQRIKTLEHIIEAMRTA